MKKKKLNPKLLLKKATVSSLTPFNTEKIVGGSATCVPPSGGVLSICNTGCPSAFDPCVTVIADKVSNCCNHLSVANPPVSMCNPCTSEPPTFGCA